MKEKLKGRKFMQGCCMPPTMLKTYFEEVIEIAMNENRGHDNRT